MNAARRTLGRRLLIAGVLLYAGVLLIAPIAAIIGGALQDDLGTLINAMTQPAALNALRLTVTIAVLATIVNTIIGVIIAWVLVRHRFAGRRLFDALVDLPFVVSPVIVGFVMIVLFGRQGWLKDFPIRLAFSFEAMVIVTIFVSLPFVIREVMPVLSAMTPEEEEAAYTLGASRWFTFRRVVFPAIRHALIYGIVLTLARAIGEFGAVAVVGGGVQGLSDTATIYIYQSLQSRDEVSAYGMAITLALISVFVLMIMNRLRGGQHEKEVRHVDHLG